MYYLAISIANLQGFRWIFLWDGLTGL